MKRLIVAALALIALAASSHAAPVYDPQGRLVVTNSFNPTGNATLSVSSSSSRVALASADSTVVVQNVGAVTAFVKFGSASVTAATTDTPVLADQTVVFNSGGNVDIAAITSSSTTTLRITTGTGTPTITAGSGSGGSAAATIADGADVAQGATTDAACAADNTSGCTIESRLIRLAQRLTSLIAAIPTTQYPVGATPITASATGTTGATTATLAGTSGKTTYLCGFSIRATATAAAVGNATVTGMVTGTLNFTQFTAPASSGIGLTEPPIGSACVPASATNTGIAVISAAPGTGGVVSVSAWGFQL